jgi:hypothetical protein
MIGNHWYKVSRRDPRAVGLYSRHYSAKKNGKGKSEWLAFGITAPGEGQKVYMTSDCSALFVWNRQKYRKDKQTGIECAVFRNEGEELSSALILEAEQIAWEQWPGERLYTFVDPSEVTSSNPGYCFKQAGWELVRDDDGKPVATKGGLLILEKRAA